MKLKLFITFILAVLISCTSNTENECMDDATIIGSDYRECMCCGGWFIEIGEDTLRFDSLPEGSKIVIKDYELPLAVRVEWDARENPCLGDEIDIIKMTLRE